MLNAYTVFRFFDGYDLTFIDMWRCGYVGGYEGKYFL